MVKRIFDIIVSSAVLVLAFPVIVLVALSVRIFLGSPVLFRQQRPGLQGKPFELLKFRSMRDAMAPDGSPLPDSKRLTDFGKFLRKSSLDELPSLLNILKGEMSLVGPRPLLMQYMELYSPEQNRRHDVRPGLTGWAQVNGRNDIDWQEKFRLDVEYVNKKSFWFDCKILLLTVKKMLTAEGVSKAGHCTTDVFTGNDSKNTNI